MHSIRSLVYKLGFRPKYGSIFFSPSLNMRAAFKGVPEAFKKGLNKKD